MKKPLIFTVLNLIILLPIFSQINDSLVAHYFLDGNGDDAIGNNHGTVMGAIAVDDRNGAIDGAYQFDGIDDWINIGNTSELNITGDITVSAWVKTPTSWPTSYHDTHIYARYTYSLSNPTGVALYLDDPHLQSRSFSFILKSGVNSWGNDYAVSLTTLQLNTWYFVVGVREGNLVKVYVDGVLENTDVGSNDLISYGANPIASIGEKNASATGWYDGIIDDVKIYKRALLLTEIQELETVGVEENNVKKELKIYPNPTRNLLNINTRDNFIDVVEVFNITGQKIFKEELRGSDNTIQLDINALDEGLYFLKAYSNQKLIRTSKFLKVN